MDNEKKAELTIPQFGKLPQLVLDMTKISNGENRLFEAQVVNPATYSELEYVFNEGYREAKKHLSQIGYQITRADKALREAKSIALLDEYPTFLKEKNIKDSVQIRDAYLERVKDYTDAQDRIDMLRAVESLLDSKVKVFENTCRYMKKSIDLIIRSGVDSNKYSR
jgi:hypothetical protein